MMDKKKVITVFGSSRPEEGHAEYAEAVELGKALAEAGFAVCTGGYGGVMEGVSRGAREAGGRVLAVTSTFFRSRANRWVDEEMRTATWQDRLFELVRLGDGYVACKRNGDAGRARRGLGNAEQKSDGTSSIRSAG
jgi:uncharacterized protein (TIGR00725 family)